MYTMIYTGKIVTLKYMYYTCIHVCIYIKAVYINHIKGIECYAPPTPQAGEEVCVLGRSQKRGYLIVDHMGGTIHIPYHYTELRVSVT